jgi:hypothetical protein
VSSRLTRLSALSWSILTLIVTYLLDVRLIIYILDCIAERDGWGEASFVLNGRYFVDLFNSLFTLCRGGAVTSFANDLTFQTKISDSIWREHKNTVGISDFVEAIISKMSIDRH